MILLGTSSPLWASPAAIFEGRVVQVPSGLEIGKHAPDEVNEILGVHISFRVTWTRGPSFMPNLGIEWWSNF